MMIRATVIALSLCTAAVLASPETPMRHVGDYLLQSHFKLAAGEATPIPMKPMVFRVYTDGMAIRVVVAGDDEAASTFEIYCSDGISRQRSEGGALEVIPGVQATSRNHNILRHLRVSAESLTITTFPSVSDQTIVSHAIAAEPVPEPGKNATETPNRAP
jgi:hypothetical protein